ncbi:MAG: glycosyltransferase [Kiritimatiellae bacterium]|nr:glycosyltransferase [Kiritimatiellia bacterium]
MMNVLFLAPHPYYQERGTPIAVNLLLRVLSERGDKVDILTYHEGEDRGYKGVTIHRIKNLKRIRNIRPGLSLKKIICDFYLYRQAVSLCREQSYDVIHAVEESAFMAKRLKRRFGIPYIFDMDSSMPEQIVEKKKAFSFMLPVMRHMENSAIKGAAAVLCVCDRLIKIAQDAGGRNVTLLTDISLLGLSGVEPDDLVEDIETQGTVFMYIGNLQPYQGIDLVLDGVAACSPDIEMTILIIGGAVSDVEFYREKAQSLGIGDKVQFLGPRPLSMMSKLFDLADVLVSPRTQGINTPMKIYSYLDSGKAVLATDLPTHTQVMSSESAFLVKPHADAFAEAMTILASDGELRARLASSARALIREKYSWEIFSRTVNELYDKLSDG